MNLFSYANAAQMLVLALTIGSAEFVSVALMQWQPGTAWNVASTLVIWAGVVAGIARSKA